MQVLKPPDEVSFLLISSDKDFRHHIQLLKNTGYEAIVVHNAVNRQESDEETSSSWQQALELHATKSFQWHHIVNYSRPLLTNPHSNEHHKEEEKNDENEYDEEEGDGSKPVNGDKTGGRNYRHKRKNNKKKRFVEHLRSLPITNQNNNNKDDKNNHNDNNNNNNNNVVEVEVGPASISVEPPVGSQWKVCVCSRWVGVYGFLLYDESISPEVDEIEVQGDGAQAAVEKARKVLDAVRSKGSEVVRVYVHYQVLSSGPRCFLSRGEVVLCRVEASARWVRVYEAFVWLINNEDLFRGPRAAEVKVLSSVS